MAGVGVDIFKRIQKLNNFGMVNLTRAPTDPVSAGAMSPFSCAWEEAMVQYKEVYRLEEWGGVLPAPLLDRRGGPDPPTCQGESGSTPGGRAYKSTASWVLVSGCNVDLKVDFVSQTNRSKEKEGGKKTSIGKNIKQQIKRHRNSSMVL